MHKRQSRYIAFALAGALVTSGLLMNSARSEDAKSRTEDRQAIRQAAAAYSALFESGDVEKLLSYWAPDAEYIDESGKMTQGHEAIASMIRKNHEGLKGYKLKLQGTGLRFVTNDVALADGKATLISPQGKEDVTPFAAVWVKKDGKWLVRSLRDLGGEDAKPTTPADHLKPLEPLLGDWVCADKDKNVEVHCRRALNGSFIALDYTIKNGKDESTTAQRFGWDPVNKQIRSWYFDSTGGFGEATCTVGGDGLICQSSGVLADGRVGTATDRLHFPDDKSFVFQARNRMVDGRPLADLDLHFVRLAGKE
jgi:uncharacterized protein (TIGR02246 family)